MYDQHLHSWNSFDCDTDPRDNVRRALELGLDGLTFTEHYDTHPVDWPTCRYDHQTYSADISKLRAEFGSRIFIGQGVEICYQPDRMPQLLEFISEGGFDLVVLSVHWAGDWAIHDPERWTGKTAAEMSRAYLTTVLQATETCLRLKQADGNPFHVLGHLDLVRRYSYRYLHTDDPLGCGELVEAILRNCLAAGVIPEINTSSLRQGLTDPMPGEAVVRRYAELGGRMIALG
ncbi:MAG: histidinol-phosphatase HisJ family protein, partial [bacterium]|nr:histidinol-phosphatase HisJ family protein [bacterium]